MLGCIRRGKARLTVVVERWAILHLGLIHTVYVAQHHSDTGRGWVGKAQVDMAEKL